MPAPAGDVFPFASQELHLKGHRHPIQLIKVNGF